METIKEALTFDDVLLLPRYSNVLPSETDISLNLTQKINLMYHFCLPQWICNRSRMAISIAEGGIGIIHRNLN